jgi:ketosteroid isomerase-like protein
VGEPAGTPAEVRLAVVREAIDAFNEGGLDRALHLVDPEIEWHPPPGWMGPPVYRGYDGLRDLIAEFTEHFADYQWKALDLVPTGDGVVGRVSHAGVFSGQRIQTAFGIQWVFRGSRIVRTTIYESWEQAAEAAGVELPPTRT